MYMKSTLTIIMIFLLISCDNSFDNKESKALIKNNLAMNLVLEHKLDSAILLFHESIAIAPNYGTAYWNLLMIYCQTGVKDSIVKGINLVHKLNKLEKDSMSNLMYLGFFYDRIGMEAEANRCYNQYIDNVEVPKSDVNYYFNRLFIGAKNEDMLKLFKENVDSTSNYEEYKMHYELIEKTNRKEFIERLCE